MPESTTSASAPAPVPASSVDQQPIRHAATAIINKVQSNTYVQYATEKLAPYTSPVIDKLQPVIATASSYSNPLVDAVDSRLSNALSHVPDLRRKLVDSQWFHSVDSVLSSLPSQQLYSKAELTKRATDFYTVSSESFVQLAQKGRVKRSEFLAAVKTKLAAAWDDGLIAPAETLLETARSLYAKVGPAASSASSSTPPSPSTTTRALSTLRSHLPSDFQDRVASVYEAARARSQSVYDSAVRVWLAKKDVSLPQFVGGVKASLGVAWSEQLETPLKELFTSLNKWQHTEVKKWHEYLDQNKDGSLSVSDLVGSGKVATVSLVNGATGVVASSWHSVLGLTQSTIDTILPAAAVEEKESSSSSSDSTPTTLTSITTSVSSRLLSRATSLSVTSYNLVRDFSATRVSSTVGVDPVAKASDLVTQQALPAVEALKLQIQERVEAAANAVKRSTEALKGTGRDLVEKTGLPVAYSAVNNKASEIKTTIGQTATSVTDTLISAIPERIKTASPEIQSRLVALKDATVELTSHSSGVLINDPLADLPAEVVGVVVQLPSLLLGYLETNETTDPTGTLAKVENVLTAVKELFYWSGKQAQVERAPAQQGPSDALMAELKNRLEQKEADKTRGSVKGSNGNYANGRQSNGSAAVAGTR